MRLDSSALANGWFGSYAECTAPLMGSAVGAIPGGAGRLNYLPVGLFAAAMGLTVLGEAWRLAHVLYGTPLIVSMAFGFISIVAFIAMFFAYLVKCIGSPRAARDEFRHPIRGNMFGTVFVSLMLLPLVVAPVSLEVSRVLWGVGAAGMLLFALTIIIRWLSDQQSSADVSPVWIIPVIGLLDIPLAVPLLQLQSLEGIAILGLGVGFFFALPMFTLVLQRQIFGTPMPDALKPSMMILVAPTAIGFSSYMATTGRTDLFAEGLFAVTLFLLLALVGHLRHLPKCCPFRVSWWAVSFPLAACSVAGLRFASMNVGLASTVIALLLLIFSTAVIVWLLIRTVFGIARGELRALSV